MAQAQAEAKEGKKKRGEGPLTISYLDNSDKSHKRVPSEVKGIVVTGKDGKSNTYLINDIPPAVRNQLAAMALAKRADTFVRNTVKKDGDQNVIDLTNNVFDTLKSGKVYSRGESAGSAGRPFDVQLWVDTMIECAKLKKMPAPTDKQIADFRTQLEALAPKERRDKTLGWQKDATFALALKRIQTTRLAKKAKEDTSDYNALDDMF